jgi:hypothetical protein
MTHTTAQLEWRLLALSKVAEDAKAAGATNKPAESTGPIDTPEALLEAFIQGDYAGILKSKPAQLLFGTQLTPNDAALTKLKDAAQVDLSGYIVDRVATFLENVDDAEHQFQLLVFGAACLNAFLQTNWTGPTLKLEAELLLPESVRDRGCRCVGSSTTAAIG